MSDYMLPRVYADSTVTAASVGRAHRALCLLPEHVAGLLRDASVGVYLRADFPWEEGNQHGEPWSECGGYWSSSSGFLVINTSWCTRQGLMNAVVFHEVGHALSIDVLAKPHRVDEFRAAWSRGRAAVAKRWPDDYRAQRMMGVYCGHWTRGVQEVWADAFCWLMGAKRTIHPSFASVFTDCLELVHYALAATTPKATEP